MSTLKQVFEEVTSSCSKGTIMPAQASAVVLWIVCKSILSKMFAITSCHTRICAKLFGPIYGFYTPVCMFKSAISLMVFFNCFPHSTSHHIKHIKLCVSSPPNTRLNEIKIVMIWLSHVHAKYWLLELIYTLIHGMGNWQYKGQH